MKKTLCIFILSVIVCQGYSQESVYKEYTKYLDSIRKEHKTYVNSFRHGHNAYKDSLTKEYNLYINQLRREYNAFKKEMREKWGDKDTVQSTPKVWVEYSNSRDERSIVDFEKGTAVVEVLSDTDENAATTKAKLEKAVSGLLVSQGKTVEFNSSVVKQGPVTKEPVMKGQLDMSKYVESSGKSVNQSNTAVAKKIVASEKVERKVVKTKEGPKYISIIKLPLAADHLPQRAKQFSPIISKFSKQFDVEEPVIYAVIEQESAFNPVAVSSANAYGLMQLIPTSGGKDAYIYVFKDDWTPTPEYLFVPENNIQLGTAFFHLQMRRYFSGVKDIRSKMLCAIAAYNTGQRNVYIALAGKNNKYEAEMKVNMMSYEQLYNHLKLNLRAAETRDYIQKVTTKMKKYIKIK